MIVPIPKIVFLSLLLTLNCLAVFSQDDPYKAEIGLQTGLNIYSGDVNSIADRELFLSNLQNMKPDFGAMFRYRFNQRLALRFGYDYTSVKGNYTYRDNSGIYSATLNNPLHVIDLWGEFNFFDLENNPYKLYSKRYSPYIFAGFGGMVMPQYKDSEGKNYTLTFPFGVGFKMKFAQRWNFNIQLTNRLLLGDDLEGMLQFDNPLPKTISNPMNHDLHSGISIGFSYDFWTRNCNCNESSFSKSRKPASQRIVKQKRPKEKP
ncbi:MAG: DUF6089 family protein [Paludibacteraceae bacterium]